MDAYTVPTRYWHALDDGRVQCDVCPRACKLRDGQKGVCFVRGVQGDGIVLTTYGRSSGFCVDPIEKKPLNHFLPGSRDLQLRHRRLQPGLPVLPELGHLQVQGDRHPRRRGLTGGDRAGGRTSSAAAASPSPTTTRRSSSSTRSTSPTPAMTSGSKAVAVTAGYICPEPRAEFYSHLDAANVDLKGFTEDFYRHTCGGELGAVLDTLEYLHHETDVWFELTTLLIPGLNDSRRRARRDDRPGWSSTSAPTSRCTSPRSTPTTGCSTGRPRRPRRSAGPAASRSANGVRHAYTGNVHDSDGQSTYCPGCGSGSSSATGTRSATYRLDDTGHCTGVRHADPRRVRRAGRRVGAPPPPVALVTGALRRRTGEHGVLARPPAGGRGRLLPGRPRRAPHGATRTRSPQAIAPDRGSAPTPGARGAPRRLRLLGSGRSQRLPAPRPARAADPPGRAARPQPPGTAARPGVEQRRRLGHAALGLVPDRPRRRRACARPPVPVAVNDVAHAPNTASRCSCRSCRPCSTTSTLRPARGRRRQPRRGRIGHRRALGRPRNAGGRHHRPVPLPPLRRRRPPRHAAPRPPSPAADPSDISRPRRLRRAPPAWPAPRPPTGGT